MLDRLLHHVHIVQISGESYRLKDKRKAGQTSTRTGAKAAEQLRVPPMLPFAERIALDNHRLRVIEQHLLGRAAEVHECLLRNAFAPLLRTSRARRRCRQLDCLHEVEHGSILPIASRGFYNVAGLTLTNNVTIPLGTSPTFASGCESSHARRMWVIAYAYSKYLDERNGKLYIGTPTA
jgi:hypothetical protein